MAMTLPLRRPWSINFYTLQLRTPAQSRRSRQGVTGPSSQYQEITMAKGQGRCHCHLDSNPHDKSISFRGEKAMPFFFFFFLFHLENHSASGIFHALLPVFFFTLCCQIFARFFYFFFFFFVGFCASPLLLPPPALCSHQSATNSCTLCSFPDTSLTLPWLTSYLHPPLLSHAQLNFTTNVHVLCSPQQSSHLPLFSFLYSHRFLYTR